MNSFIQTYRNYISLYRGKEISDLRSSTTCRGKNLIRIIFLHSIRQILQTVMKICVVNSLAVKDTRVFLVPKISFEVFSLTSQNGMKDDTFNLPLCYGGEADTSTLTSIDPIR